MSHVLLRIFCIFCLSHNTRTHRKGLIIIIELACNKESAPCFLICLSHPIYIYVYIESIKLRTYLFFIVYMSEKGKKTLVYDIKNADTVNLIMPRGCGRVLCT